MLRGMSNPPGHDPRPPTDGVKELRFLFPPFIARLAERLETLAAVQGVALNECKPGFRHRQRRCADVDPEHVAKPEILAYALMHHLLMDAAASPVGRVGTDRQILVGEHAPDADDFDALGFVGL